MAMTPRARPEAGTVLLLCDALLALIAWPLAIGGGIPDARVLVWLLYPACFVLFLYALGLYRRETLLETRRAMARGVVAALLGGVVATLVLATSLAFLDGGARGAAIWSVFALSVVVFSATAFAGRVALSLLRRRGAFRRRLLVVGAGERAFDLIVLLRREGRMLGYDLAFLHDEATMGPIDPRLAADPACRILPYGRRFLAAARAFGADQIIVAPDERRGLPMEALLACRIAGFPVQEYLQFLEREIRRVDIKRLEIAWLLYSDGFVFGPLDRWLKRALDVAVSGGLLLLASPFLLAAALAVRLEDGGPALYRQERVTRGGRVFRILKLRTMRVDAEKFGAVWATDRDPRITRFGSFMRRSRIDELPQLINILKGDMSFVGPRPERPEFVKDLAAKLPLYEERHTVRAGLTGWAQVNYPYGASLDDARSKLSYDLYYVKNFSVLFDLLIILQTLRVVLWPGAAGAR
ncbi:MAG: TIGR03013 family PEP-CTERM/XrtA system glycosyltransferase [Acetobacteraceae bacterium]|nr:TIGR03013 family PEP-CTERM/XrtA system glycosyltransferase [Acetobacteraceae bacterium]